MSRIFESQTQMFEERQSLNDFWAISGMEELIKSVDWGRSDSILQVCNYFGTYLDITPKWALALQRYVYNFTTRKVGMVDYMDFFGSPYLGLQKITFTSADRNQWFSEIFDVDEEELKENLHAVRSIKTTWAVVGDVFNLTIPYLVYRVFHSKLDPKTKHQAMVDLICMYHYKCLTSIVNNDYPYMAKREVVLETYNRLSLKYDIKRYGSWRELIIARAEFILNPKTGIHYNTFTQMNDDKKIIYMVGDIQDRLRGVVNDINKVFHDVKNKVNIVSLDGNKVNLEDGVVLKNVAKEVTQFKNYIEQILTGQSSFYKEELLQYAVKDLDNAPIDKLGFVVQNFPALYNSKKGQHWRDFIDEIVIHLFEYLHQHDISKTNMYSVLIKMRGAYNSPRSQNDSVKKLRKVGDDLIKEQTGIKTPSTITGLRTAFLLYVVLRVLSKDYYQ